MGSDQCTIPIGIVVASDRAFAGNYEDKGGPGVIAYLDEVLATPFHPLTRLVPDEEAQIAAAIVDLVDQQGCPLVLVTGGTGPAPRDVTPEAVARIADRTYPGFGEAMRAASLREVPTAILSRQTAVSRGKAFIITLPGKPSAIKTCLDAVFAALPYGIDLLGGPRLETRPERLKAFRPGG